MKFWSLTGFIPYEECSELQKALVQLRATGEIPDTVLFLEHQPVITRGRGLQWTGQQRPRQMPAPLLPQNSGIQFCETQRGGDLTYHGPGQWVVYPICKLDGHGYAPKNDVVGFIRRLENTLIAVLAEFGVSAEAIPNATGIWIKGGEPRKIASMGIAVRKWVSWHGIALNVVNDLQAFSLFSPCGFSSEVMTRLKDHAALDPYWREQLEVAWAKQMGVLGPQIERLSLEEAWGRLPQVARAYLPAGTQAI